MMNTKTAVEKKPDQAATVHPLVQLRERLMAREGELRAALTDVSVENFIRAVMTSASLNPEILGCSWQSIWNSCLKACRDGLLPDGVDGALVPYKGNVTWIPMYQGLLRRFRRSGQFKWVTAGIVRNGEQFEHWLTQDGEHFKHVPGYNLSAAITHVYALATTKDGGSFIAVLPIEEANKIRAMSKATRDDSPWKMWPEEMYKKTALRRLSKVLPSARDYLDEPPEFDQTAAPMISIDDLPRITGAAATAGGSPPLGLTATAPTTQAALDQFAGSGEPEVQGGPPHDPETGELPKSANDNPPQPRQSANDNDPLAVAYRLGQEAKAAGVQRRAVPPEYREASRQREAIAWQAGHDGAPIPDEGTLV